MPALASSNTEPTVPTAKGNQVDNANPSGSAGAEQASDRAIRVFLTGYGPFRTHDANASFEIIKRLPLSLSLDGQNIELIVHPEPVRVSYPTVRGLLPEVYAQHRQLDFVVHLGVADLAREQYVLEKMARRDGYKSEDVDGVVGDELDTQPGWEDLNGGPYFLETSLKVDQVIERVQHQYQDIKLQASTDAGLFLCEYIYYNSLFHYRSVLNKSTAPVVFLHVPPMLENEDLERGRKIVLEVVRAIVDIHVQ